MGNNIDGLRNTPQSTWTVGWLGADVPLVYHPETREVTKYEEPEMEISLLR